MFELTNANTCDALIQLPNRQIAASSDNDITIWDPMVNANAPIRTLNGHSNSVYSLALSLDASLLASGSGDNTIKLWVYATQTTASMTLSGHAGSVRAVCFASNQMLASGSDDNSIKIWNTGSGK